MVLVKVVNKQQEPNLNHSGSSFGKYAFNPFDTIHKYANTNFLVVKTK